jgi:hypothetical protein
VTITNNNKRSGSNRGSGDGADRPDLLVFGRAGWKRFRFDQIAEHIRENVMATPEDSKTYDLIASEPELTLNRAQGCIIKEGHAAALASSCFQRGKPDATR